jgi:uncharacterized spore protein YtfJ
MTVEELMGRIGQNISVQRVFGEPVERDGVTLVPVAVVAGGGGGGGGKDADGADGGGGGFGLWSRGIGVYEIRDGRVRFVPAFDVVALILAGTVTLRLFMKVFMKASVHRSRRRDW